MKKICLLQSDYNRCAYTGDDDECRAPNSSCGMCYKLDDSKTEHTNYVRKPRWYEEYYKRQGIKLL